jgi:hypothetical protein
VSEKEVETVRVETHGDPKAGFTLIGSIAANGDRLSLFLIAKGVTFLCHNQFVRLFPGSIDHSKSGRVNEELFLRFLCLIRSNRGAGPIALVLDQYPAHVTPLSHAKECQLDIKLILVPKGGLPVTSFSIAGSRVPLNQRHTSNLIG